MVASTFGRLVKLELRAADSTRRSKPDQVQGAAIFAFVGTTPPADPQEFTFQGATTRTTIELEFGPAVPAGSQVWISGYWFSPTSQPGPMSTPISTYIAGGIAGGGTVGEVA